MSPMAENCDAVAFKSYYLGLPEAAGISFRQDVRIVVTDDCKRESSNGAKWGWLWLHEFWEGGKADRLNGRHRTMFVMACYFTVLIDQMFHSAFPELHPKFELLTSPPKLTTTICHIHPMNLLSERVLRNDSLWHSVYLEAREVFEAQLSQFLSLHMPEANIEQVLICFRRMKYVGPIA